jgi:chemotaxis protein histidine kinase CheA
MLKRDMEALGGRVWFETETGKGTRFEIELPLA